MRVSAAVIGVAAALGLCVSGGLLTYDAIDALVDGARIGETRTPIPGTTDVELEEGKYVVFYEVFHDSVPAEDIAVPIILLSIRRDGDGPALALKEYGSSFTVEGGGRAAKAALTVQVPSDGRYRITASGRPEEAADPAVVLGKPVTRRIFRLVLGVTAFVAGLAVGILVIAVAAALVLRNRRARGSVGG